MKGESLYEVYCEELKKQGVSNPVLWGYLAGYERTAWNELAKFVESLVLRGAGR